MIWAGVRVRVKKSSGDTATFLQGTGPAKAGVEAALEITPEVSVGEGEETDSQPPSGIL